MGRQNIAPVVLLFAIAFAVMQCVASAGPLANIIVTFHNTQTSAGTANAQYPISFNAIAYNSYEANSLGNIRFFLPGNPTQANELYSWCQSGCNSMSANATFWVRFTNTLTASTNSIYHGNLIANMSFQSANTNYDAVFAGECAQCSITGTTSVVQSHQYFTAGANTSNYWINVVIPAISADGFWICGASEGSYGGRGGIVGGTSFSDDVDDGDTLTAQIGTQGTGQGICSASDQSGGNLAGVGIGFSGGGSDFQGHSGGFTNLNTLNMDVPVSGSLVVVINVCSNGDTCTVSGMPSGCISQQYETNDGFESAQLWVCNSLASGSYALTSNAPNGADQAIGSYIVSNFGPISVVNSAGTPSNYAEYDNGKNIFNFYMNGNSVPAPSVSNIVWGADGCDATFLDSPSNDLVTTYVDGINALMINSIIGNAYQGNCKSGGNDFVYFIPANNLPQSFVESIYSYTSAARGTDDIVGMAGSSSQNYAGYWNLYGDFGFNNSDIW